MKLTVLTLWVVFTTVPVWAAEEHQELLLGLRTDFDAGEVVVEVASSGCTTKADFRCEFKDQTLTIFRLRRDSCKAMPHKMPITFTLKELGLSPHQPFALGNRIIVNENLTDK